MSEDRAAYQGASDGAGGFNARLNAALSDGPAAALAYLVGSRIAQPILVSELTQCKGHRDFSQEEAAASGLLDSITRHGWLSTFPAVVYELHPVGRGYGVVNGWTRTQIYRHTGGVVPCIVLCAEFTTYERHEQLAVRATCRGIPTFFPIHDECEAPTG
jgi:hypothetical protein